MNTNTAELPESSPLAMYGDATAFARRQAEGYTEVAFGSGSKEPGGCRVSAFWAFFRPDGQKMALGGTLKDYNDAMSSKSTIEQELEAPEFEKYLTKWGITMTKPLPLVEVLERLRSRKKK